MDTTFTEDLYTNVFNILTLFPLMVWMLVMIWVLVWLGKKIQKTWTK